MSPLSLLHPTVPSDPVPVEADRLLLRMCQRHDLDPAQASDLERLVGRALISPPAVRKKILTMIEGAIAKRADGDASATLDAVERDLDEEVLRAVAQRVHDWEPGSRFEGFGEG